MKIVNLTASKTMTNVTLCILVASAISLSTPSHAELLGYANGRIPSSVTRAPLSVELGYAQGNFSNADYDNKGLRLNYQVNGDIALFADIGQASVNSSSENSLGFGVFYNLGKVVSFSESIALKGSIHTAKLNSLGTSGSFSSGITCSNGGTTLDPYTLELVIVPGTCGANPTFTPGTSASTSKVTAYSVELLMAGGPIEQLSLANNKVPSWYANTGVHSFSGSGSDTEFSIGAGLVLPVSTGEAYLAIDYISDIVFGFGFRYFVRQ